MFTFKNAFLAIFLLFIFSCKKDENIEIKDAPPFATAGTNQNDIEQFQVTLNADSLKAGQSGKWTILQGLVEDKVFFSGVTKPNSKFNGMPGETYQLKWTVSNGSKVYSESTVKITFKDLKAVISNISPGSGTKFVLSGNSYDKGLWEIEGKYASLNSLQNGGVVIPTINSPNVRFQGYAYTSYKITWTTYYGSKSASSTINIKTGDYLESEALSDLQLDKASYRLGYENGHITKLNLQGSGIAWILRDTVQFPALQALKYLKWLDLSGSSTFEFPAVISDKYTQLEYLDLNYLKFPSFPANIGRLTKLKQLMMGYADGIRTLPESFGDLENLEYFRIVAVGLTSIPESFSKLKRLKYFECTLNPLQKLPVKVGDLSNLEVLLVKTKEALPSSISKLTKLRRLNFIGEASNNVLPADLGNMIALDTLTLDGNFRELPASFSNLDLIDFQLSGPLLVNIPDDIGNMKNLESIAIYGQFKNFPESFTRLSKLRSFTAGSYALESLPANIGNLKNVAYMSISFGKFKTVPESIGKMANLTELRLENNQLEALPVGFFDLPRISVMRMANNKLTSISKDFGKLSGTLRTLYIYGNNLSDEDRVLLRQLLPTAGIHF